MIYTEDGMQSRFAKVNPLLHVICSIFEFECAKHESQVELIDFEGHWALVAVPSMFSPQITRVCLIMNEAFPRKDKEFTATFMDHRLCAVKILATCKSDLAQLN